MNFPFSSRIVKSTAPPYLVCRTNTTSAWSAGALSATGDSTFAMVSECATMQPVVSKSAAVVNTTVGLRRYRLMDIAPSTISVRGSFAFAVGRIGRGDFRKVKDATGREPTQHLQQRCRHASIFLRRESIAVD